MEEWVRMLSDFDTRVLQRVCVVPPTSSTGPGGIRASGVGSKSLLSERGALEDVAPCRKGSFAQSATEIGGGGSGMRDVDQIRDLVVNRQQSQWGHDVKPVHLWAPVALVAG